MAEAAKKEKTDMLRTISPVDTAFWLSARCKLPLTSMPC